MDRIPVCPVSSLFLVTKRILAHKVGPSDYMDGFVGKTSLRIRFKVIIPVEQTYSRIRVI